jgi:hypothetical protein
VGFGRKSPSIPPVSGTRLPCSVTSRAGQAPPNRGDRKKERGKDLSCARGAKAEGSAAQRPSQPTCAHFFFLTPSHPSSSTSRTTNAAQSTTAHRCLCSRILAHCAARFPVKPGSRGSWGRPLQRLVAAGRPRWTRTAAPTPAGAATDKCETGGPGSSFFSCFRAS